jgi:hypothetical protein
MKTIIKIAALLAPCLLAANGIAIAADSPISPYLEGSYASTKLQSEGFSTTPHAGVVRAGVMFDKYWGVEALGILGGSQGDLNVDGIAMSLKIKNAYGAYLKGQYPVSPHFELFARAGWLHATVEAQARDFDVSASSSDSSFSYGAGFQVPFGTGWYAQADYMSYYSKSGDSIRGPSIGLGYRFH